MSFSIWEKNSTNVEREKSENDRYCQRRTESFNLAKRSRAKENAKKEKREREREKLVCTMRGERFVGAESLSG